MLKTGKQWLKFWGDQLLDPDGWRHSGRSLDSELISYPEYMVRMAESTTFLTDNLITRYNGLRETAENGR